MDQVTDNLSAADQLAADQPANDQPTFDKPTLDQHASAGPAPAGSHSILPFFAVPDCAKAMEFYTHVLGATVVRRMDGPGGTVLHAELRLGDSLLQLSDPMPDIGLVGPPDQGNAFTLTYWTADPDAVFARAVEAGATEVFPVNDVFSGDRMGVFRCPYGVRWCVARHDRDVPDAEIEAAAREWVAESQG
jgi:PhnB protein